MLNRSNLPEHSSGRLGKAEFLVLLVATMNPVRDPAKLIDGLGLRPGRVARAWQRLQGRGLIVPAAGDQPGYEATEEAKSLVRDAMAAMEMSGFEPDSLRGLRSAELKAPFPRSDRPGGL